MTYIRKNKTGQWTGRQVTGGELLCGKYSEDSEWLVKVVQAYGQSCEMDQDNTLGSSN